MSKRTKFKERGPYAPRLNKKYFATDSDKALVNASAIMGAKPEKIAKLLGIGLETLYHHYPRELEFASMRADAMVVANLFRQVTKDDLRAIPGALAWTRLRLRWGLDRPGFQGNSPVRQGVMKLVIVNDPEEGLDDFRADGGMDQTIEVSGHEPSSRFVDPFEGKDDPPDED